MLKLSVIFYMFFSKGKDLPFNAVMFTIFLLCCCLFLITTVLKSSTRGYVVGHYMKRTHYIKIINPL